MNRLFWRLHQIDPGRPEPKKLQHAVRREALADYLGEQSGLQAELAAEEVADLCRFSENIDALTARIVRRGKGSRVHPADAAGMCGIDCG